MSCVRTALICSLLLVAVSAAVLSNMVGIQGLIGGSKKLGSFMLQRQIDIDVLPNENLYLEYQISLDESYNGNELPFNLPVMYVNERCRQKKCSMCNGKGAVYSTVDRFLSENSTIVKNKKKGRKAKKVRRHRHTPCLTVHTASPCPVCKGMGVLVDPAERGCDGELYHTIPTPLVAKIPRGSRPGSVIKLVGKGHERLTYHANESRADEDSHLDIEKTRGNVELKITSLYIDQYLRDREQRNATLSVEPDHVEVLVTMSPEQALYGFRANISYFNNRTLVIDRSGKITYPGSNSTVRGLGLPRVVTTESAEEEEEEEDESETEPDKGPKQPKEQVVFEDLIVQFKLVPALDDPENTYATAEEKEEFARLTLHCANDTSYGVGVGVNVTANGDVLIKPSGKENVVITGGSFTSGVAADSGSRLQVVDGFGDSDESGGNDDGRECSAEDADKYRLIQEDRKLRQLLRLLTKRREEEEEEEAGH